MTRRVVRLVALGVLLAGCGGVADGVATTGAFDPQVSVVTTVTSTSEPSSSTTSTRPLATTIDRETTSTLAEGLAIEPPSRPSPLVLIETTRGNTTTVSVTFTDGRQVEVEYPTAWGLSDHSWVPQTALIWELEEPRPNGLGYLWASATFTYSTNGWNPAITYRPEWSDEERAFAEESIELRQQENGFVTLHTPHPLRHSSTDPDQGPTIADLQGRPPSMNVGGVVEFHADCHPDTEVTRSETYVSWCDQDARVAVVVFTAPHHQDKVMARIDVKSASED